MLTETLTWKRTFLVCYGVPSRLFSVAFNVACQFEKSQLVGMKASQSQLMALSTNEIEDPTAQLVPIPLCLYLQYCFPALIITQLLFIFKPVFTYFSCLI